MSLFFNTIDAAINKKPGNQLLAKKFLSSDKLRFLVGKNDQSLMIAEKYKIDGIIDDSASGDDKWHQIPVITSKQVPLNSIVLNCSTSISPVSVYKNLTKIGIKNVLSLHEIIQIAQPELTMPEFVQEMRQDYKEKYLEWSKIYQLLSDNESKNTLIDIMRFRLTADPIYMNEYTVRFDQQYFEDFMHFSEEVFVDIGGFNGDTTELFCKRYRDYKKIYFFEPSNENMKLAKTRLIQYKNIEYIQSGLSDQPDTLSFDPNAGSSSSIIENGPDKIDVTTLDIKIKDKVSFLKMDIEGWELKALEGCKSHIINDHPKLAIAVYHKCRDFYEIPNYILSLVRDYNVFLRHYTEGWSETVMYFVPK